jgi:predicted transcriptional regulator
MGSGVVDWFDFCGTFPERGKGNRQMSTDLSIQLSDETFAILNSVANATGLNHTMLIERAIKAMDHLQQQRASAVTMAIAEADAGLFVPIEDVFDDLDRLIDSLDRKHAA